MYNTAWWWQVWCAETCWRIDSVWKIHLVHVKMVIRTNRLTMHGKCKNTIQYKCTNTIQYKNPQFSSLHICIISENWVITHVQSTRNKNQGKESCSVLFDTSLKMMIMIMIMILLVQYWYFLNYNDIARTVLILLPLKWYCMCSIDTSSLKMILDVQYWYFLP